MIVALIIVVGVLGYAAVAGFVFALLSSNYAALRKAGLIGQFDDPEVAAGLGSFLWPLMGVVLLVYHRLHYGVTAMDRRLARSSTVADLRRALAESRQREIERMERDLGIGRDRS